MARLHMIPPGACLALVPLRRENETFTVEGYLVPGTPARGPRFDSPGEPAEPAEFQPLSVADEKGVERPELLPVAEERIEELTAAAEEVLADQAAAVDEDRADAERDDRRMGL